MTPDQHVPLIPWAAHVIQWLLQRDEMPKGGANRKKSSLSSDWGLQLDPMKPESLVIAGQHHCGEYVLEPCTHQPMCLVVYKSSPFESDPRQKRA